VLRARSLGVAVIVATVTGAFTAMPAEGARSHGPALRSSAPPPFLDVRDAQRRAVDRRGDVSLRPPTATTRSARSRLRSAGAVVEVDPLTGTSRVVAGRVAPLSPPAAGDRRDVAARYVREHLSVLNLSRSDLGSLELRRRTTIPGGAEELGYRQYVGAIPSFDGGLRVVVDAGGRVVSVIGAAQRGLSVASTHPTLTAAQAMRRLMQNLGVRRAVHVASGPAGPRATTTFSSGEGAALVAFGEGTSARLAWQLDLRTGPAADYVAVVDAADGHVLYRANRVKAAANDASVWEQYPGAPNGGTAQIRDLTPYLSPGATDLSGPYAHAWSDTNDNDSGTTSGDGHIVPNDHPDAGEAVTRTGAGGSFAFAFHELTAQDDSKGACDPAHKCSWNFDVPTSWQTNRAQDAVQTFYYVNRFRDHLLAAPISFTASDGNFDNGDRLLVNTDDGAATASSGGPDSDHVDNAYMDTTPDGTSPTMAMFLFLNNGDFRDVNGGDDAAVVYHEYTHGLSGRLITVSPSGGEEALNSDQSAAMGEGWSDWYAKDFLVGEFPSDDTTTAGDVDMGKYIDSVPHTIRTQGLDCPVGAAAAQCPGAGAAGSGGYTYGDFGRIFDPGTGPVPEAHADGEIWAETLWDLRAALGSEVARAIVTQGMRLSPPEPTFLDERDAIITADRQLFPDADHSGAIWQVFGHRGIGWNATSPTQDAPVEGFKRPPTAALTVSPSPATQGQPVSVDASRSNDSDGHIVSYDFDFQGDGVQDVVGTTDPRQSFTYPGRGTVRPIVTVHDDEDQSDTAARTLQVAAPATATPTPGPTPTPTVGVTPGRAPSVVLAARGAKGRIRFTVGCDSACAGSAKLTVTRNVARRLHLGPHRTVGTMVVKLTAAGQKRYLVKLTRRTLKAMKRAQLHRIVARLTVTLTDAERQRTAKGRVARIRR
jgi:hypothetical protein